MNLKTSITLAAILTGSAARAQQTDNIYLFANSNYHFTIHQPKGWIADTTQAKEYKADLILYRADMGLGKDNPVIKVTGLKKDPANPSMENHNDRYTKNARMQEIQKQNPVYKDYTYIRFWLEDKGFITYVNPRPSCDYVFCVTIEHDKSAEDVTAKLAVEAFLTVPE